MPPVHGRDSAPARGSHLGLALPYDFEFMDESPHGMGPATTDMVEAARTDRPAYGGNGEGERIGLSHEDHGSVHEEFRRVETLHRIPAIMTATFALAGGSDPASAASVVSEMMVNGVDTIVPNGTTGSTQYAYYQLTNPRLTTVGTGSTTINDLVVSTVVPPGAIQPVDVPRPARSRSSPARSGSIRITSRSS